MDSRFPGQQIHLSMYFLYRRYPRIPCIIISHLLPKRLDIFLWNNLKFMKQYICIVAADYEKLIMILIKAITYLHMTKHEYVMSRL